MRRNWFAGIASATTLLTLVGVLTACGPTAGAAATWSAVTSPLPAGTTTGYLTSVSCTTSTHCFAVGNYYVNGGYKTLTVRWNGQKWSVVTSPSPSPNPNSATLRQLFGVSCPTPTLCFAVGVANNRALVEQWNGKAWTVIAAPNPNGVRDSALAGVSCPDARTCFAVGNFRDQAGPHKTLIERWNGTRWAVVAHPKLTGGHRYLNGVSCASATSCFAVGTHSVTGGGDLSCEPELDCFAGTLVEQWNGARWAVVASPNGASALQSALAGVSCTSAKHCVAVGTASPEGLWGRMLTERWDGTRWSVVAGATPAGVLGGSLYGVSCASSTSCWAGGGYLNPGSDNRTIVDRYNGTRWTIAYRANLSGLLRGISCTSASSCVAVGGTSIQRLG